MKLLWTRHAERQLRQRTALEPDHVLAYFALEAAVLSRREPNGIREYVLFSAADKDCFAVILGRDNQVITIMPIKWRRVAPGFIDEARQLWREKKIEEVVA